MRRGQILWAENPHAIQQAIALVERGWTLCPSPDTALQLVIMYDRVGRHDDALNVLRLASKLFPENEEIRCYAATTIFRHGRFDDLKEYAGSVLRARPSDIFSQFVLETGDFFAAQVEALVQHVRKGDRRARRFFLTVAIWGDAYVDEFLRYSCAALLAPGNLPGLSGAYSVYLVIFTTPQGRARLEASPIFRRLLSSAEVSFHIYPSSIMFARKSVEECYGPRLGEYYFRSMKFALMSAAHYVSLEAGREVDALVTAMGADNIFSDSALTRMAEKVEEGCDVVLVSGFRVHKAKVAESVEARHRKADGSFCLSSEDYVDLLIENIPPEYFVDSPTFADFPILLCWRVPGEGVLVHANHYHPYCVAAGRLVRRLEPTIDPIDGRFLARHLPDARRHLVQDASIVVSDWGDVPVLEQSMNGERRFSARDVGLWLCGFWDGVRAPLFRSPLRLRRGAGSQRWNEVENTAAAAIEEIVGISSNYVRTSRSWRLDEP